VQRVPREIAETNQLSFPVFSYRTEIELKVRSFEWTEIKYNNMRTSVYSMKSTDGQSNVENIFKVRAI